VLIKLNRQLIKNQTRSKMSRFLYILIRADLWK